LLLTQPATALTLWKSDDPNRPRFGAAFWSDGGIERIHSEAPAGPTLVQLIAETAVDLVNQSTASGVTRELMDQALDKAIVRGDNVLRLLMQTESELPASGITYWASAAAIPSRRPMTKPSTRHSAAVCWSRRTANSGVCVCR